MGRIIPMSQSLFDTCTRPSIAPREIDHDRPCVRCGYSLRGLKTLGRCPECGTMIQSTRQTSGVIVQLTARQIRHLAFWSVVLTLAGVTMLTLPPALLVLRIIFAPPTGTEKSSIAACLLAACTSVGLWAFSLRRIRDRRSHEHAGGTHIDFGSDRLQRFTEISATACVVMALVASPAFVGFVTPGAAPGGWATPRMVRIDTICMILAAGGLMLTAMLGCFQIAHLAEWFDEITLARQLRGGVFIIPVYLLAVVTTAFTIAELIRSPLRLLWLAPLGVFLITASLWLLYLVCGRLAEVARMCLWAGRNQKEVLDRDRRVNNAILCRITHAQAGPEFPTPVDPPPIPLIEDPPGQ
jgi:hypothetical protein